MHKGRHGPRSQRRALTEITLVVPPELLKFSYPKLFVPHSCSKRKLKVEHAWKIKNAGLHSSYKAGQQKISAVCGRVKPQWRCTDVRDEFIRAAATLSKVDSIHLEPLQPQLNETMLLTGVPVEVVLPIMKQGFNERFSGNNAGSMFGDGTYGRSFRASYLKVS